MAFTREEELAIQQSATLKFYSDSYSDSYLMIENEDDLVISKALLKQAEETLLDQLLLGEGIFEGMEFGLEKLQIEMRLKERLTVIHSEEMKDQDNAAEMQYC